MLKAMTTYKAQKQLYYNAFIYLALGLLSGLFYREFTKANDFPSDGFTQLSVLHTHLLVLGFMVPLILLVLEKLFELSNSKLFGWAFWLYNGGLLVTMSMMVWRGIVQVNEVNGAEPLAKGMDAAISGMAGIGHILLTVSLMLLMIALGSAINYAQTKTELAAKRA